MVRITTNKEENGSTKKEHELSKHAVDHSSNTIKQKCDRAVTFNCLWRLAAQLDWNDVYLW